MKRIMTIVAAAALGSTGSALADGTTGGGQSAQAPSQLQGGHGQFTTNCDDGGWDTPGGGIPTGCSTGPAISSSSTPLGTELPNAQAGQCFARIVIPAVYDNVPHTVTTHDAYDKLGVTEPAFAPDSVSVKIHDEGIRYTIREPRYEAQDEQILVKPAYERLTVVPAVFDTVDEHVQVGQPRLVWRPGRNLSGVSRTDPNTGAVYCLVEEPGKNVTVHRRVVRVPEQIRAQSVPAQYISVTKQVMVDPGGVDQVAIPAKYRDVQVSRLVTPAQRITDTVSPQTKIINTRILRSAERFEWVPVLCDTNATRSSISRIQRSLAQAGHYNGRVDGISGPRTEAAIRSFQVANNLPANGTITAETADALGVGDLVSGTRQAAAARTPPAAAQSATRQILDRRSAAPQPAPAPPTHVVNAVAYIQPYQEAQAQNLRERPRRRLSWAGKD